MWEGKKEEKGNERINEKVINWLKGQYLHLE